MKIRTNFATLTTCIREDQRARSLVGSRVDVVTVLADQMARVARFSFIFFTALAVNKNQGDFM